MFFCKIINKTYNNCHIFIYLLTDIKDLNPSMKPSCFHILQTLLLHKAFWRQLEK